MQKEVEAVDLMILGEISDERLNKFKKTNPENHLEKKDISELIEEGRKQLEDMAVEARKDSIMNPGSNKCMKKLAEIEGTLENMKSDNYEEQFKSAILRKGAFVVDNQVITKINPVAIFKDFTVNENCCYIRSKKDPESYVNELESKDIILEPREDLVEVIKGMHKDSSHSNMEVDDFVEMQTAFHSSILIDEDDNLITPVKYYEDKKDTLDKVLIEKKYPLKYDWSINFYDRFIKDKDVKITILMAQ